MADLPHSPLPPPYDDEDTDDLPPTVAYPQADRRPPAPPTEEFSGPLPSALEGVDSGVPFDLPTVEEYERQQQAKPTYSSLPPAPPTLPGTGGLDPNPDLSAPSPSERTYASPRPPQPPADPTLLGSATPYTRQSQPQQPHTTQPAPSRPPRPYAPPAPAAPGVNPGLPRQAQGAYVPPPPAAGVNPGLPPPSAARQKPQRRALGLRPMTCLYAFIGLILTVCGGSTVMLLTAAALFIPRIEAQWEGQLQRVDDYRAFETTFIYDRYGDVLFEAFGEGRRERVDYEQFPRDLINATVAIEDGTFWENPGINPAATFVAFTQFIRASDGERVAGGSTITQQLVRNVLFDFEKRAQVSAARKVEEIVLAVLLTQRRSKEDILTLYLNEIYYGNLAYGAQTAARTFFDKDVEALTLGEAALLAGLPQAPADLDPLNPDPVVQERVAQRWQTVLDEMVQDGYISDAQRREALSQGLQFNPRPISLKAPHFTVYAQAEFERIMTSLGYAPDEVARGGYRVYTTLDQNVNQMAQQVARDQVTTLAGQDVSNAAVVVLKPLTGEIISMVGSIDYANDAIDGRVNVAIALRQPGSTMKAFTYAAALERGLSPGAVIWDTPTEIGIPGQPLYVPRNYDGSFHGPMTMRFALANSYNIPAVQTLRLVGVDYLLSFLRRFGVETLSEDASQYGLSLTLGGGEMTLMELTAGYAVFANQGNYVQPTSILCIADTQGRILYQYENSCLPQAGQADGETIQRGGYGRLALDPRIAYLITDILSDNGARSAAMGSSSPLRTDGIGTAVKTGTTNDFKDNWTVGYTRNVAVGVWVGNNDGRPMRNVSGLAGAAPIWNQVMLGVHNTPGLLNPFAINGQLMADKPEQAPGGMSYAQICDHRRLTDPATDCPRTSEWLIDGALAVPDLSGSVQYLDPAPRPAPSATLEEISPDVYRALVLPLPPDYANTIQFQLQPGDKQPPPPKYCRMGEGAPSDTPGVQALLFIAGPTTSQSDAAQAEQYARNRGLAYMPIIECSGDMLNLGYGTAGSAIVPPQDGMNITQIVSPFNGQVVTGDIPIIGTALFDMSQVNFYHLFIIGGPFSDWTYLGTEGRSSIVDGQLGTLNVGGLPSGTYGLRLALMRDGGQIVQPPYDISFVIP